MTDNNEKKNNNTEEFKKSDDKSKPVEISIEDKLKETEDKLLRSLAEIEKIKEEDLKKRSKTRLNLVLLILLKKVCQF